MCVANSPVVAGCCSALRTEALLHGCWSVLHLMRGPGPLLAQPSGTDTPCPYEPCPALTGEALRLSLCGQQMSYTKQTLVQKSSKNQVEKLDIPFP